MAYLDGSQAERLFLLIEECGEAVQAASKALRHGYESFNPFDDKHVSNRDDIEKEIGHVLFAVSLLVQRGDLNPAKIERYKNKKATEVFFYLHHNKPED